MKFIPFLWAFVKQVDTKIDPSRFRKVRKKKLDFSSSAPLINIKIQSTLYHASSIINLRHTIYKIIISHFPYDSRSLDL